MGIKTMICDVIGCERKASKRGLCNMHYLRQYRHGNIGGPERIGREQEHHGMYGTKIYGAWKNMIDRCRNPKNTCYLNYGGRGIFVCDDWGKSFSAFLRDMGFSIRLCVMMQNTMVDSPERIDELIKWCKNNEVTQLTVRPIRKPVGKTEGSAHYIEYIENFGLSQEQEESIKRHLFDKGSHVLTLMHGTHAAKVYDVNGQNICISDCLTVEPTTDDIRTLIYYADGRICFDWQYEGARIL